MNATPGYDGKRYPCPNCGYRSLAGDTKCDMCREDLPRHETQEPEGRIIAKLDEILAAIKRLEQ